MKPESVSTKQKRIAELAARSPAMAFTSLNQYLDAEWLRYAYECTRKDGAVGADGQTAQEYAVDLEQNLQSLLDRLKSGRYRAPPVRRHYIDKPDGGQRALGIPSFEDKVAQRAIVMLLEPIYEQDFVEGSYGFRPGRGAHDALGRLWKETMNADGGWVLEVDISKFFDTLGHEHLRELVRHRVKDGVLLRLIGKWLNAGVMEEGCVSYPESGSPQGGVISPMLANIYLHYVLDKWFEQEVQPRLAGKAYLIRYADDFVIGFANQKDALRVQEVLPKRFERYGLKLHPDKTRLVRFTKPSDPNTNGQGPSEEPESFDLLGFTHYWARSLRGNWVVKRKTSKSRLGRALKATHQWCRRHLHDPLARQQQALGRKIRGHCAYYGITGNSASLSAYRMWVLRIWRYWLSRRNRERGMTWDRFNQLLARYPLPSAVAIHSVRRH